MNMIDLVGCLTRDPELEEIGGGRSATLWCLVLHLMRLSLPGFRRLPAGAALPCVPCPSLGRCVFLSAGVVTFPTGR